MSSVPRSPLAVNESIKGLRSLPLRIPITRALQGCGRQQPFMKYPFCATSIMYSETKTAPKNAKLGHAEYEKKISQVTREVQLEPVASAAPGVP
jgi:hypothetical protein